MFLFIVPSEGSISKAGHILSKWANCTLGTQLCHETIAFEPFPITAICLIAVVRCPLQNLLQSSVALNSFFVCVVLNTERTSFQKTQQLFDCVSCHNDLKATGMWEDNRKGQQIIKVSCLLLGLRQSRKLEIKALPSRLIFLLKDLKVARPQCFWPNNDQTGLEMLSVPTSLVPFRASLWNTW